MKMEMDLDNREFLARLEGKAIEKRKIVANPRWKSVYNRLAEILCELDAYIARSTEIENKEIEG